MAGKTFHCPNCYASLTPGSSPTLKCEYCSSTIIVPPEFRDSEPGSKAGSGAVDFDLSGEQSQLLQEISHLIEGKQKIQAIKTYRDLSGSGLKEAKEAIEALEAGQPIMISSFAQQPAAQVTISSTPGGSSGCGCIWFLLISVLLVGGLAAAAVFSPSVREVVDELLVETGLDEIVNLSEIDGVVGGSSGRATAVASFGSEGTGPGFFSDSRYVAAAADGTVYVGDFQLGRVQRFDAGGNYLSQWTVPTDTPLQALTVDRNGIVYVIQSGQIFRYDGTTGEALGELPYETFGFDDVVVDVNGRVLGTGWLSFDDRVVRFDAKDEVELTINEAVSGQTGRNELNPSLAVDGLGNIYVMGSFNNVVCKYNPDGRFINRFGGTGDEPGQFRANMAIAVDGQGRVYVSDIKGIQVFDENGRYLDTLSTVRPVYSMAFTPQNELLVSNGRQITKYRINH
jgi:streptogramin lyase